MVYGRSYSSRPLLRQGIGRAAVPAALLFVLVGCKLDALTADPPASGVVSPTEPPPPPATQMTALGGSGQVDTIGARLAAPYVVRVTTTDGRAVGDVEIAWTVEDGAGLVEPASSRTDSSGVARAFHTLGDRDGMHSVSASSAGVGGSPLVFVSRAMPGAPTSLTYTQDASDTRLDTPITPPLMLSLADRMGNRADEHSGTATVELVEGSGTPFAQVYGTLTVAIEDGVARFSNVRVDLIGIDFRLRVRAAGLDAVSRPFDVTLPPGLP